MTINAPPFSGGGVEHLQPFRPCRIEQPVIGADKSEWFGADCAENETSCQLHGVVGAQSITVNHLECGVDDRLSDEAGLEVALHAVEKTPL